MERHKETNNVYKLSYIKERSKDFDSLEASVMSIMYLLSEKVDLNILFPLLPIHRTGKEGPGSIISARIADSTSLEKGHTRGVFNNSKKKGFMKNAILINIVTNYKQLSVKIFRDKIAVCGMKSEHIGLDAANIMLDIIKNVQRDIDYIKENKNKFQEFFDWLKINSKDQEVVDLADQSITKHMIKLNVDEIPNYFEKRIVDFILNQVLDFSTYEDMIQHVSNILELDITVIKNVDELSILSYNINMINYNYDLGFNIKRNEFAFEFGEDKNFKVQYKDIAHYAIRVYHFDANGKKNTFSIYRNGLVTQSGPSKEIMKIAYNEFMNKINEVRDKVTYSEKVLKVKYKKV